MTTWSLKPKVGTGWKMNDNAVTMNSNRYTMNYYYTDTAWTLLSIALLLIIN